MTADEKNYWDVLLATAGLGTATVGGIWALFQWRIDQAWKRAARLDEFIREFEASELLMVARAILDWSVRDVELAGKPKIQITNEDVIMGLRDHEKYGGDFTRGNQALVRDAMDAVLLFFTRLEVALAGGLIAVGPTGTYFSYWLQRIVKMDQHKPIDKMALCLKDEKSDSILLLVAGVTPDQLSAEYVLAYGDTVIIESLADRFKKAQPATSPKKKTLPT